MTKFASMRYVGLLAASALLFFASAADAKLAGNKLSSNSWPAAKADATILAANKLAASKLPPEGFLVHRYAANPAGVAGLIATDAGREVLTFIVSCALPEGTSLVATGPGDITYEFFGEIGLAKEWLHNALDNEGRGWMSACLFARTSGSHVPVPLSMRGQHRALALAPGEAETYTPRPTRSRRARTTATTLRRTTSRPPAAARTSSCWAMSAASANASARKPTRPTRRSPYAVSAMRAPAATLRQRTRASTSRCTTPTAPATRSRSSATTTRSDISRSSRFTSTIS